jgi:hypothetical protein
MMQPVTLMKARIPFDNPKIARTSAVITYSFSLLLAFFTGELRYTHAAPLALFVLTPVIGLAGLSPFIWFGARWAMILVFLIGAALELLMAISAAGNPRVQPGDWWFSLDTPFFEIRAFPLVLGMLTLMHAMARANDSRPTSQTGAIARANHSQPTSQAGVINKVYAGLVYAYCSLS